MNFTKSTAKIGPSSKPNEVQPNQFQLGWRREAHKKAAKEDYEWLKPKVDEVEQSSSLDLPKQKELSDSLIPQRIPKRVRSDVEQTIAEDNGRVDTAAAGLPSATKRPVTHSNRIVPSTPLSVTNSTKATTESE